MFYIKTVDDDFFEVSWSDQDGHPSNFNKQYFHKFTDIIFEFGEYKKVEEHDIGK